MRKELQLKKSLALLGHGKWKSALGHTLLIIGLVLVSLGAWAQVDPANPNIPEGLVMKKWFEPDDPNDGTSGNIFLETYVTGHSVAQHKPTDIVLVLDVSGSMDDEIADYEYTARTSQAYTYRNYGDNTFYYLHTDGNYYPVERYTTGGWFSYTYYHLRFQVGNTYYYLYGNNGAPVTTPQDLVNRDNRTIWTGVLYEREVVSSQTKMDALKTSVKLFVEIIAEDAEQHEVDHTISIVKYAGARYYNANSNSDDPTTAPNATNLEEGNNTYGQYNYNYTEVLVKHRSPTDANYGATYIKNRVDALNAGGATSADFGMYKAKLLLESFQPEEGEPERSKVVVMFTDGEPNHSSGFNADVADNVISFAHDMKHDLNATVFTVGVFGDNIDDRTDDYMNYTSSNYPDATDLNNGGAQASAGYSFEASSSGGLSEIFEAIAGASGAMALPAATIVQDAVSPNFTLPNGASDVTAYAPKYYYDEEAGEYKFEDLNDAGTLVIGTITDPATGQTVTGVVKEDDPLCGENKLPASFVRPENGIIQMDGFNFSHHWVGTVVDDDETETAHGRKIVIKIHIELADGGSWGDGIPTNVSENSYIQTPDPNNPGQYVYYGPFPPTSANVMGQVWTEVVYNKPDGFPTVTGDGSGQTVEIDSPEDLAWFISEVNGRHGYSENNTVASHPKLNAILTADIDMSAHNWVPIGAGFKVEINPETGVAQYVYDEGGQRVKLAYEGTFDGNGHVITGLKNNASKFYKVLDEEEDYGKVVVFPGMFSTVKGTVKNVFVLDADFRGKHHNPHFIHHGIIADTLAAGGNIFNCEAVGRITCNNDPGNPDYNPTQDQNLKYGGLVGLNQGTIHSCMAMAELTGYTLGGMIAENQDNGKFSNGFTNGVFHYLGTTAGAENKPVAGIVAINPTAANVSNCYVRFSRESSGLDQTTGFRQIAGGNNFDSQSCYSPSLPEHASEILTVNTAWNQSIPSNGFGIDYTNTRNQSHMREDRSNDNMAGGAWETVYWTDDDGVEHVDYKILRGGTPLLKKLNAGVANGQASWKRTTAIGNDYNLSTSPNGGNINGDYPILEFSDYKCVASADGIRLDYAATLDQMLDRHNTGNMNVKSTTYIEEKNPSIYGGAINLYANDDNVTKSTMSATSKDGETVSTVVYIDENVSLLQGDGSNIEAYTGQTIKDFGSSYDEDGVRWHNVSSSLTGSKFGWTYGIQTQVEHNWDPNPCLINLNVSNDDEALFPTDARSFNVIDFYSFYEPKYHWINFKRNSSSHWHMDSYTTPIAYTNETEFVRGKGYLLALYTEYFADRHLWNDGGDGSKNQQFIQNRGMLNNGNVPIKVTCTDGIGWTGRQGYNLLGNPYQSYLDFDVFVNGNATLLGNSAYANTYAVYDPDSDSWLQYKAGGSSEGNTASRYINMHQGFFIQVNGGGTATFTNDMRTNQKGNGFRGNENHYPLVNFTLTDNEGNKDIAVLEVSRPENDGAKKIFVSSSKGRLSLRHDNEDFAILFRDMQSGSQPLYFEAKEDGTFTLSWNTANANFSSLTLVDNLTGVKYDMLANDSYTFQGSMSDYRSRFKVVFGAFTDVEENEETVTDNFAFFDGSDWVVNGQGQLTVTDMTGRTVYSSNLTNDQNRVSLNGIANGIYLMRVANGQNVNVQKIIIK